MSTGKRMALALVFFLVLTLSVLPVKSLAAGDTTPPTITSVSLNGSEFRPGDTIQFTVEAYDEESGFPGTHANYIALQNTQYSKYLGGIVLTYNSETHNFTGSYTVPSDMTGGDWYVYSITIYDAAGNGATNSSLNSHVTIINTAGDVTPPAITGVTLNAGEFRPGDIIQFTVDASDEASGFPGSHANYIALQNTQYSKYQGGIALTYRPETHDFTGSYTVPSDMIGGDWYVYSITIYDAAGNGASNYSLNTHFTVINTAGDATPPTITNVSISAAEFKPGDVIQFTVDAYDGQSGFPGNHSNYIALQNSDFPNQRIAGIALNYNPDTKQFNGSYTVQANVVAGNWYISCIAIYDAANNCGTEFSSNITFQIESIFDYGSNTLYKGSGQFDPLSDITAISPYEGDITGKIECAGEVDTDTVGIYLIKYSAAGKNNDIYRDYRWISVVQTDNTVDEDTGETYFSEPVNVSVPTDDDTTVLLEGAGETSQVSGSVTVSDEGTYNVSVDSSNSIKSSLIHGAFTILGSGNTAGNFNFIIDKTAPVVKGVVKNGIYTDPISITFNEGTALLNGLAFKSGARVSNSGNYQLEVKDKAGNRTAIDFTIHLSTYKVTFNSLGGSAVVSAAVTSGSFLTPPKAPTKAGMTFAGWYRDPACTIAWNYKTDKVTGNITLYAKWVIAVPLSVKAYSASYDAISVSWAGVIGVSGYEIYRATSSNGQYSFIASQTSTALTNKGLATGKIYFYKVRAFRLKGAKKTYSAYSAVVSARPVPAKPASVKAIRVSSVSIKLNWAKVAGATMYEIQRSTSVNGAYITVKTTASTSMINTNLKTGTIYYYRVRACRVVNGVEYYGGYSIVVSIKP